MRSAMSMIELVFAIVIMGIAVMSLPLILTQVQNNNAFAMQQEAILAAKTKIGDILTYEWDNNSYSSTAQQAYVLDTTAHGDSELSRVAGTTLRQGHVNANYRRKFYSTETNASTIAKEGLTDVDDFNNQPTTIAVTAEDAGKGLDYVFTLTMTPTINYTDDNATYSNSPLNNFTFNPDNANTITNIKVISVKVSGGDQNITLRAFTCNIGESTLLPSRPYQ